MNADDGDIVSGWHSKLQTVLANITPSERLSRQHAKEAAPGTGQS